MACCTSHHLEDITRTDRLLQVIKTVYSRAGKMVLTDLPGDKKRLPALIEKWHKEGFYSRPIHSTRNLAA